MFGYDAARWHAVLNDLPAALLLVAVVFDFAAAALKRESLRWAAIWTLWAGVLGGWVAVVAGELASKSIDHGEAIHDIMVQHERQALVTMGFFTVILVWKMYRRFALRPGEVIALRVLSVLGVVGLCYTGMAGGRLVFEHAAGMRTQQLQAELENREQGHHHEAGEEHDEHGAPADTTKPAGHVDPPGTPPHKH